MDKTRSEFSRGTRYVRSIGDKVRAARLRWFGYGGKASKYIGRRMLMLEPPGRRPREGPDRRFMNVVKVSWCEKRGCRE